MGPNADLLFSSILWGGHVSHSWAYESCLACQHLISNVISFVNLLDLLTIFCFSMLTSIDKSKLSKNGYNFALREDKPSLSPLVSHSSRLSHSRHAFALSVLHETSTQTREEISSAGKPIRSKNNFRGITIGRGPIWGIHSLSFILSWWYQFCVHNEDPQLDRIKRCKQVHL